VGGWGGGRLFKTRAAFRSGVIFCILFNRMQRSKGRQNSDVMAFEYHLSCSIISAFRFNFNLEVGVFQSGLFLDRVLAKTRQPIHRMQIWRTTWSAPGTSYMKARLVRL